MKNLLGVKGAPAEVVDEKDKVKRAIMSNSKKVF